MDTLSDIVVDTFNDREIMLLLGQLRAQSFDLEEVKSIACQRLKLDNTARNLFVNKLNELIEDLAGMEEEVEDMYYKLNITVDDLGYYPVLFRGKEKPYKWINLCNIEYNSLPLNPDGFKTAQLVRGRIPVPPLSLTRLDNGNYKLNDGRHRYLAFKLNGLEKIPAYVNLGKNIKE